MLPNVLPVEASHSSFDIIETRPLLTIHVYHSSRKLVPFMLQINQHSSLKLQAIEPTFFIYTTFNLEIKCIFTNPDGWSLAYDATTSANSVSFVFVHNALPFLQLHYNGEWDKNFICKQNYARLFTKQNSLTRKTFLVEMSGLQLRVQPLYFHNSTFSTQTNQEFIGRCCLRKSGRRCFVSWQTSFECSYY